jgi:hypothetical protein
VLDVAPQDSRATECREAARIALRPRRIEPGRRRVRGRALAHAGGRAALASTAFALALALAACGSGAGANPWNYGGSPDGAATGDDGGPGESGRGGNGGGSGQAGADAAGGGDDAPGGSGGDDAGGGAGEGGWSVDAGLPTGPAFYVATNGSDSNSGTDVGNPFLTIGKAASVVKAGDTVVIRAGVYREAVTLTSSGSSGSPITFQNYPGETVTISGADEIPAASWTVHSGSIYQAPMSWTLGNGMDQIFVDGVMMNEARWPNSTLDVSNPKASTAGSVSGTTSMTMSDPALSQAAGFWNGAQMNMGPGSVWVFMTYTITSSGTGQLVFTNKNTNSNYTPKAGNPYYLWGTLNALDTAGECFHDTTSNTLYLWTPQGDNPSGHVVEAKRRATAFDFGDQSYVVLRGVRIFSATLTMGSSSHDNVVDTVAARYVGHDLYLNGDYGANAGTTGFQISGTNNTIANSAIAFSSGNGLVVNGTGHKVTNCLIHDADYATTECAGISPGGSDITITNNTIYNTGRSGMLFKVSTSKALNNLIYNVGLQVDDLGGIYTYGHDGMQSEIAHNIVHTVNPVLGKKGMAIYLDNGSSNYVVDHNLGYDMSDDGMIINTVSTNNLIYNNTFSRGIHGGGTDPGVQIINNIFGTTIKVGTGGAIQNNIVSPTDPMFVDPSSGNYQLKAGSPAIDMGTMLSPYTNGYVGSAPDLGAFEYGAPAWTAGSSLTSDGF